MSFLTQLSPILTAAAAQAEGVLGETYTLGGTSYTGVIEEDENMMVPTPNGFEPRRGLRIVSTLAQFDTAPSAATRPRVVARSSQWNVISVKPGPLQYTITCVIA